MKGLFAIIMVAALGWGGYWFVGSRALDRAYLAWFDTRTAQGWLAEYSDISIEGFPNRFDTTISGIDLRAPGERWSWSAPFLQILALSYNLRHVIVIWPHDQTIAARGQSIDLASEDMRASIALASVTRLALDHSELVTKMPVLTSDAGWRLAASEARFATRPDPKVENGIEAALNVLDLAPGGPALTALSGVPALPPTLSDFRLDLSFGLSGPLDRSALGHEPPQPTKIVVNTARAAWGDMLFQASGSLDVDRAGVPTGSIKLELTDWRTMLDVLTVTGALRAKDRPDLESVLEVLAGLSGDPNQVDVTLIFRGGFVAAGMVPIGPAPRLLLR